MEALPPCLPFAAPRPRLRASGGARSSRRAVRDRAARSREVAARFAEAVQIERAAIHCDERAVINLLAAGAAQFHGRAGDGEPAAVDHMDAADAGFAEENGAPTLAVNCIPKLSPAPLKVSAPAPILVTMELLGKVPAAPLRVRSPLPPTVKLLLAPLLMAPVKVDESHRC